VLDGYSRVPNLYESTLNLFYLNNVLHVLNSYFYRMFKADLLYIQN